MKAVLAAEIGEQIVVTLTMTKKELAQAAADPQLLAYAICGVCGAIEQPQGEEECARSAEPEGTAVPEENAASEESAVPEECPVSEEVPVSGSGRFSYKDIAITDLSGNKEAVLERVIKHLIARNEIPVDMAEIESEAEYNFKASMQSIRYDVLFGRAPEPEIEVDPEALMAEIREDLILEQKENYILTKIIESEGFEAAPEELLAEAEAMARRQNTTVEMVQSFFGKDFAGLAGDVKKRKAKDFLYSLATEG